MKDYLIKDFTDVTIGKGEEPTIQVINEKDLWDFLQSLKNKPREIAIFEVEVGNCLLDWS